MDDDDDPIGRILTRRQAIALGGLPALTWLAGYSTGSNASGTESTGGLTTSNTSQTTTATPMTTSDPTYPATGTMTSTSVATSDGTAACVAQPELTEGPYYVDETIRRADIRTETDTGNQQPGTKLDLGFKVFQLTDDGCKPLCDAIVDIWHANASGVYSDVQQQRTSGKVPPGDSVHRRERGSVVYDDLSCPMPREKGKSQKRHVRGSETD